jgi:hypothetical protein
MARTRVYLGNESSESFCVFHPVVIFVFCSSSVDLLPEIPPTCLASIAGFFFLFFNFWLPRLSIFSAWGRFRAGFAFAC